MDEAEIAKQMFSSSYSDQQKPELVMWQLNPEDVFDLIDHYLSGDIYNPNTKQWKLNEIEANMQVLPEGKRVLLGTVQANVSKNLYLSELKPEEVYSVMLDLSLALNKAMYIGVDIDGKNIYGKDLATLSLIKLNIENAIFYGLKWAENGGGRKLLTHVQKSYRLIKDDAGSSGRRFFGLLPAKSSD